MRDMTGREMEDGWMDGRKCRTVWLSNMKVKAGHSRAKAAAACY